MKGSSVYSSTLYFAQFDHTLSAGDQAKTLDYFSVSFTGTSTLMVFGASGTPAAVPEPAAYAVFAGLAALGLTALRRRRALSERSSVPAARYPDASGLTGML